MSVRDKSDPRLRDMAALDALFLEAAETERKLPPAIRKQKMSSWVEYVKTWESYGWHDFTPSLPKATPEQVTRFELAMDILNDTNMDADDKRLIWAVAHSAAFNERGPRWSALGRKMRVDHRTVRRKYTDALVRLYYKL